MMILHGKNTSQQGLTLIEVILYVGIVSIFLSGLLRFTWDTVYGQEKVHLYQELEQTSQFITHRLTTELSSASEFTVISPTELTWQQSGNTSNLELTNGQLLLNGETLHSQDIIVTNFAISDLSLESSRQVRFTFDLSALNNPQPTTPIDQPVQFSVELKGQASQARQLLVDFSNTSLSANSRDLEDIDLENTGLTALTIDQLYLSWTGTSGGENLTQVQFNGGSPEWTGNSPSGSTINISDVTIPAGGTLSFDQLRFSASMDSATLTVHFIMSDTSVAKTLIELNGTNNGGGSGQLIVTGAETNNWGSGYCYEFEVTNQGSTPVYSWQINFDLNNASMYTSWNGIFSNTGTAFTITPVSWNATINANQTISDIGFCANISGNPYLPQNLVATVPTSANNVTASLSIYSDWASGYCATLTVNNTGSSNISGWSVEMNPNQSVIGNSWNANFTDNNPLYTITPLSWNASIPAGGSINSPGFCASKSGANYQPTIVSTTGF